jgi:hypothetical protein
MIYQTTQYHTPEDSKPYGYQLPKCKYIHLWIFPVLYTENFWYALATCSSHTFVPWNGSEENRCCQSEDLVWVCHNSGGASSLLCVYEYAPVLWQQLTESSQENFHSPSSSYNSLKTAALQHLFLGICQTLSIQTTFCPFPRSHTALGQDLYSD